MCLRFSGAGRVIVSTLVAVMLLAAGCGSDSDQPDVSPGLPLSVEGLLTAEPTAEVSVVGFVVINASGPRLCAVLAESFPPQCGGESVELLELAVAELDLEEEQGVRWTDLQVVLSGSYDNAGFTVRSVG